MLGEYYLDDLMLDEIQSDIYLLHVLDTVLVPSGMPRKQFVDGYWLLLQQEGARAQECYRRLGMWRTKKGGRSEWVEDAFVGVEAVKVWEKRRVFKII